jgi:hypothetical protein
VQTLPRPVQLLTIGKKPKKQKEYITMKGTKRVIITIVALIMCAGLLAACGDGTDEKVGYTLTVNGGTGGGTFDEGTQVTATATIPGGKVFVAWFEGETQVSTANPYTFTLNKNTTLTAKFEDGRAEATQYTVTFEANGGTGTMTAQTFTEGTAQNLAANGFSKTDNTFIGWATTASGAVSYVNGASYTATANITLYAVWVQVGNPITLSKPTNLTMTGNLLSWDAVPNAVNYEITGFGGVGSTTDLTWEITETEAGVYELRVRAIGDDVTFLTSAWSESCAYTIDENIYPLEIPQNVQIDENNLLTWDAVTGAVGYTVWVGWDSFSVSGTSYSLASYTGYGTYDVSVVARGDYINYADSDYSTVVFTPEVIPAPTGLALDGSFLTWDYNSELSYSIRVNGNATPEGYADYRGGAFDLAALNKPIGAYSITVVAFTMPAGQSQLVYSAQSQPITYTVASTITGRTREDAITLTIGTSSENVALASNSNVWYKFVVPDDAKEYGLTVNKTSENPVLLVFQGETDDISDPYIRAIAYGKSVTTSLADFSFDGGGMVSGNPYIGAGTYYVMVSAVSAVSDCGLLFDEYEGSNLQPAEVSDLIAAAPSVAVGTPHTFNDYDYVVILGTDYYGGVMKLSVVSGTIYTITVSDTSVFGWILCNDDGAVRNYGLLSGGSGEITADSSTLNLLIGFVTPPGGSFTVTVQQK